MASAWYCILDGTEYGPLSGADLKRMAEQGKLRMTDQVKTTPTGKWVAASSVKGLAFKKAPEPSPALTEQPIPASTGKTCPSCRANLQPAAALCIRCGFDLRTGKKLTPAKPVRRSRNMFVGGIAAAALVGISITLYFLVFRDGLSTDSTAVGGSVVGKTASANLASPKSTSPKQEEPNLGLGSAGAKESAQQVPVSDGKRPAETGSKASVKWIKYLSSIYQTRTVQEALGVRLEKNSKEEFGAAVRAWHTAVKPKLSEDTTGFEVVFFLSRYHPIYREDILDPGLLQQKTARLALLPNSVVEPWQKELERVQVGGVSQLWTIGFIVDIDRLFPRQAFSHAESDLLFQRLRTVPEKDARMLGSTLNVGGGQAAVFMVQEDWLFHDARFNSSVFHEALKTLEVAIRK